jgi:DNA-binding LacI/PurR family transcriptional regulator
MTTVAIPLAELGSRALRVALAGESDPDEGSIAGEVVLRESTPAR